MPQSTLLPAKSERARLAILNAALEFLWHQPFRDISVSTLMAETALSRSAFYQYFQDVHDLMRTLLAEVSDEVFGTTGTWFRDTGDPVLLLNESLAGLVEVCYRVGPILKASDAAAATGESFNEDWTKFKKKFDDSVTARIKADQAQGLIPMFDARPVANALNRLNAYTVIEAFGEKPRRKPAAVSGAMTRVWVSTLYGPQWLEKGTSTLLRKSTYGGRGNETGT